MQVPKALSGNSWISFVLWVASLVFAAGGAFVTMRSIGAAQDKTEAALEAHMREPGHAVETERLRRLEAVSDRVQQTVERLDRSIAAICAATGARCAP
jgi:hypothetical protein